MHSRHTFGHFRHCLRKDDSRNQTQLFRFFQLLLNFINFFRFLRLFEIFEPYSTSGDFKILSLSTALVTFQRKHLVLYLRKSLSTQYFLPHSRSPVLFACGKGFSQGSKWPNYRWPMIDFPTNLTDFFVIF